VIPFIVKEALATIYDKEEGVLKFHELEVSNADTMFEIADKLILRLVQLKKSVSLVMELEWVKEMSRLVKLI